MIGTHDALALTYADALLACRNATRLAKLSSVSIDQVSFLLIRVVHVVSAYYLIKLCASNTFCHRQRRLLSDCNVYFDMSNGKGDSCVIGLQLLRTIFVADEFYGEVDETHKKTFAIRPLRCKVGR